MIFKFFAYNDFQIFFTKKKRFAQIIKEVYKKLPIIGSLKDKRKKGKNLKDFG